jgi:hypothetical protein
MLRRLFYVICIPLLSCAITRCEQIETLWYQYTPIFAVRNFIVSKQDKTLVISNTSYGVFISRDGGSSWEHIDEPTDYVISKVIAILDDDDRSLLAILYEKQSHKSCVSISHDYGKHWQCESTLLNGLHEATVTKQHIICGLSEGIAVGINPGFKNYDIIPFSKVQADRHRYYKYSICANGGMNDIIYIHIDKWIYRVNIKEKTIDELNNDAPILSIAINASGRRILLGTDSGLRTMDMTQNTDYRHSRLIKAGIVWNVQLLDNTGMRMIIVCSDGLYKTNTSGKNWQKVFKFPKGIRIGPEQIPQVRENGAEKRIVYLGFEQGIYRSSDFGQSWSLSSEGLEEYLELSKNEGGKIRHPKLNY